MNRRRILVTLSFKVDLDPVPGTFYQPEDWITYARQSLQAIAPHYGLMVTDADWRELKI